MAEIDGRFRPLLEAERGRPLVGAEAQQRADGDHVPLPGGTTGGTFQLPKLLERVDADVRVGTDAHPDPAVAEGGDGDESVPEVRLGRRAHADPRTGLREQVELGIARVRRVDDRRVRAEAAGAIEQLDGPDPVLGDALLDLAGLLVGVDVERQPFGTRVAPDLLQPLGRARPHGVGGDADPDPAPAELLDLLEVRGRGFLAEAGETSARVGGEEQGQRDAGLVRGLRGGECLVEPEVVELPDRRVAGGAHLGIGLDVLGAHGLRRLAFRLGEHHFAPGPEIAALGAPAQTALEPVRVGVDEPRQRQAACLGSLHQGTILG